MAGRSEVRSPKHYGHTRRQGADPIAAELAGIDPLAESDSGIRFQEVQRANALCREVDLAQGVVTRIVETADRNASIVCCGATCGEK